MAVRAQHWCYEFPLEVICCYWLCPQLHSQWWLYWKKVYLIHRRICRYLMWNLPSFLCFQRIVPARFLVKWIVTVPFVVLKSVGPEHWAYMLHIFLCRFLQTQLFFISRWHRCAMVAICKAKKVLQRKCYSWTASDSWEQSAGPPHLCHFSYRVHCELRVLCAC